MSINANLLKTISLSMRDKTNRNMIDDILKSCLDYAMFGKVEYVSELSEHRFNDDDVKFIMNHFNDLNFEVSSRHLKEDGYYEITVRW